MEVRELGQALRGGTFIESPFDSPVEEERVGDPDQKDDDRNYKGKAILCRSIEPLIPNGGVKDISAVEFNPRLRFFLDGSLRTKYLGEYVENERCFPILAAETACAVIRRDGTKLVPAKVAKNLSFIFPPKGGGDISDTIVQKLDALNQRWTASGIELRIEHLLIDEKFIEDMRYSMQGKARNLMHILEDGVATNLERDGDDWLVMDGAIRGAKFTDIPNTIGLAKSFSRKPRFQLKDTAPAEMITTYFSRMKVGYRSAVFKHEGERVVTWYLRIRSFPPMEPLGGIVKIDYNLQKDEMDTDSTKLVDEISAEVYALRNPSIYPNPRWPSFLYPIRLAEEVMGTTFMHPDLLGQYGTELKRAIKS